MSIALPMKVIDVHPDFKGLVELDGSRSVVDLSLVDGAKPGDYVIVHAGFAIETLDQKEADAALELFHEITGAGNCITEELDGAVINYIDDFRDPEVAAGFSDLIAKQCSVLAEQGRQVNIMEINGSHTMAIGRYGIRDMLPENVALVSGPGCPICVTDPGYIDTAVALAKKGVIIVTFEDMMRVPGSDIDLTECRAEGGDVRVCHSPAVAIDLARGDPTQEVVFLATGFETAIAPVASVVDVAVKYGVKNLSFLTSFKLIPPVLKKLLADKEINIDAFLCPPYESAIIGTQAYESIVSEYNVPCVVAGSEPLDILHGTHGILSQLINNEACVENRYARVVRQEGNLKAQKCMTEKYMEKIDAHWRGIGLISESGVGFREEYSDFDAESRFGMAVQDGKKHAGCGCNDVIKGKIRPAQCPFFGTACTPEHPVGPCMVSNEGTCSAYFKYRLPEEKQAESSCADQDG